MQEKKCPQCGQKTESGNFCTKCGTKLVETCDCWVLNRPYDCGENKCPALKLLNRPKAKP
ncbi:MAG: hypothetical protein IJQ99_04940 [Synergistaceae bacterium]|nr:hypothetical protein [Synergistaceae bacterium]